jgi:hypothetical protein
MRDMLSDDPLKRAAAFGKIASLLLVEENIDFLLEKVLAKHHNFLKTAINALNIFS